MVFKDKVIWIFILLTICPLRASFGQSMSLDMLSGDISAEQLTQLHIEKKNSQGQWECICGTNYSTWQRSSYLDSLYEHFFRQECSGDFYYSDLTDYLEKRFKWPYPIESVGDEIKWKFDPEKGGNQIDLTFNFWDREESKLPTTLSYKITGAYREDSVSSCITYSFLKALDPQNKPCKIQVKDTEMCRYNEMVVEEGEEVNYTKSEPSDDRIVLTIMYEDIRLVLKFLL